MFICVKNDANWTRRKFRLKMNHMLFLYVFIPSSAYYGYLYIVSAFFDVQILDVFSSEKNAVRYFELSIEFQESKGLMSMMIFFRDKHRLESTCMNGAILSEWAQFRYHENANKLDGRENFNKRLRCLKNTKSAHVPMYPHP